LRDPEDQKNFYFTAQKEFKFFTSKIVIYLSKDFLKDAQATREAVSHQKRTSSTKKHGSTTLAFDYNPFSLENFENKK
jgi:hypothetical protein